MTLYLILFALLFQDPQPATDGFKINPEGTLVSVLMPAEPKTLTRRLEPVPGTTIDVQIHVLETADQINYTFSYHDEKETPIEKPQIKAVLDGAVKIAIVRTLGSLEKVEPIAVQGNPGRSFEFTCVRGDTPEQAVTLRVAAKVVLIKNRLYSLNYVAPEKTFDAEQAKKFLDSFAIAKDEKQP